MKASTVNVAMWLELYGILRTAGATPSKVIAQIEEGDAASEAQRSEIVAAAMTSTAKARAISSATGKGIAAAGGIVAMIPGGITQLVGGIIAVVGTILSKLLDWLPIGCDDADWSKGTETWWRSTIVGYGDKSPRAGFPPGADFGATGGCYWFGNRCAIHKYWHDGYVYTRPSYDDPELIAGRIAGVNARSKKWEYWWNHVFNANLKGELAAKPNGQTEFTLRQRCATWLLRWFRSAIKVPQLRCLQNVILEGQNEEKRRQEGSRWFASCYWLQRDLYETCRKIGWARAAAVLKAANMERAANIALNYERGLPQGPATERDIYRAWPWAALVYGMSFDGLRTALRAVLAAQQRGLEMTSAALAARPGGPGGVDVARLLIARDMLAPPAEPDVPPEDLLAEQVALGPQPITSSTGALVGLGTLIVGGLLLLRKK